MAGSNGSPAQRGGPPPHWPAESEEQARALELERWRQQQAHLSQQGYHSPQQGHPQPGAGYAQPAPYDPGQFDQPSQHGGYAQPQPHYPDPNTHSTRNPFDATYADAAARQQGQQAHFERFASVPSPHEYPAGYDPHQLPAGGREPAHDPFDPRRAPPQFDPHHGYDPNQGYGVPHGHPQQGHQGHHDTRGDPQSWDLSNYHPGQMPQGYHGGQAPHDPHAPQEWGTPGLLAHDPRWQQPHGGQGHWQEGVHPQAPHYEPGAPAHYQQYQLDPGYEHGDPHHAAGLEHDEYDLPEEPRRGPSTMLVVGMLVGAIVVGGGLALAYKHFGGGGGSVKVAEIKRQTTPEKIRPQDPGGKKIEHSGNAFLNRAGAGGAGETRQSDVDGTAKKVSTIPIVVNRDGSLTPQSSSDPVLSSDGSGVPGLVLDGLGPPPAPPQLRPGSGPAPADTQASRLPPPPPPVVRTVPRVAELPLPKVANVRSPVTSDAEPPAPPVRKPTQRDDPPVHRSAASGVGAAGLEAPRRKPAPAVSGSGYVAVLASKRSRQEALNAFADLHSQYPDVLSRVTPDVREANLGEKGIWYRLIGGPPGSREAARDICVKLKARGMKDCWPVAY